MKRNVKRMILLMMFLVCIMTGCNNTAQLKKPEKIQVISDENITEYSKDTVEYASIYEIIKEAWNKTTIDQSTPLAIQAMFINPDSVEKITTEIRFYYQNSILVKRGESSLTVQYYSFFPMDDLSMVALTEKGTMIAMQFFTIFHLRMNKKKNLKSYA